jgi:aminoglycoside 6'-N-acetyltransferase I
VSVRSVAEGCPPGPAAFLEGIWIEPEHRRRGVARALLAAAEAWARERGLSHLASDALLDNEASHAWHRAAGFAEEVRLVAFSKKLG